MLEQEDEFLTVAELCDLLKIGQNAAYRLLNAGEIKALRNGRVADSQAVRDRVYPRKNGVVTCDTASLAFNVFGLPSCQSIQRFVITYYFHEKNRTRNLSGGSLLGFFLRVYQKRHRLQQTNKQP